MTLPCRHDGDWTEILGSRVRESRPWLIVPAQPDKNSEHRTVSHAELHEQASRIAASLRDHGIRAGDRIVIIADNTVENCIFVFAALLCNAVMVPLAPPGLWHRSEAWQCALERVSATCQARVVLVSDLTVLARNAVPETLEVLSFSQVVSGRITGSAPPADLEDLALIQYSSGTVGQARGVELTRANTLHNVRAIGEAVGARADDVGVTWLPLFHDMGLIGSLLYCTYWGAPLVLLKPRTFAMRPQSWLWAISRYGGTCSAAPNSAYHICADKLPESRLRGLDLSSWRVSFNGAELIQSSTVERFAKRFSNYGYRAESMYPVYGLAENTLAAALPRYGSEPEWERVDQTQLESEGIAVLSEQQSHGTRSVVCVGSALPDHELRVVEPSTSSALNERRVGEVQLRGPSMMRGYRGQARSAAVFTHDGWLRTGDRGYLSAGKLFVVGRYKHIVKRAGRTLDCAFIEGTLKHIPGVRAGAVAVFGVSDTEHGTEEFVIVAETSVSTEHGRNTIQQAIHAALRAASLPTPDHVELVAPGNVPRTTSGKICHGEALKSYLRSE
jgi:acyl-CoA synthetase (AMP-forming)/AMP-acid ligase II